MIRVLLVDDEVLAIRYLKNMICWEELGYQLIGEARNGRDALAIYEKEKPEIVLSDIKMPVMDGVQLSGELRKRDAQIKIILISAYQDFEYAKQAIRYNVSNYLLKHELSQEVLRQELESVKDQIERDKSIKLLSKESCFKDIIYGRSLDIPVGFAENQYHNRYIMMMIRKRSGMIARKNGEVLGSSEYSWELLIDLLNLMQKQAVEYITGLSIDSNNQLLLFGVISNSMKKQHDGIYSIYNKLCNVIDQNEPEGANFIYTETISVEQLPERFRQLSHAIRYIIFMQKGKLYSLNQIPIENPDRQLQLRNELTELEEALSYGNENESLLMVDLLFEKVQNPVWNLTELKYLLRDLDSMIKRLEQKHGIPVSETVPATSVAEVQEYYKTKIRGLVLTLQQQRVGTYSKVVQEILYYIHEHFNEEITLDIAGQVCGLNGVYLGQVFKKEVGISLARYLTGFRMEKAKRLLDEGNYTVSEVSTMVGYQTSQYFSQTFRKVTGMTPQHYKSGVGRKQQDD